MSLSRTVSEINCKYCKFLPPVYLTSTVMGSHWSFVTAVGLKKLERCSYQNPKKCDHMFVFRHNTGIGHRQTDGRMELLNNITLCMHCMLTRDKNHSIQHVPRRLKLNCCKLFACLCRFNSNASAYVPRWMTLPIQYDWLSSHRFVTGFTYMVVQNEIKWTLINFKIVVMKKNNRSTRRPQTSDNPAYNS